MAVKERITIGSNIEQFTFLEDELEENTNLIDTSLENIYLILGEKSGSFRGFEIHYERELNLPVQQNSIFLKKNGDTFGKYTLREGLVNIDLKKK